MQYSIRDPGRDKTHGRVWRVTAKGRPLIERPKIYGQPVAAQLELLKAYEDRTRYWTRRALRERTTAEVLPALRAWVGQLDPAEKDYEHHLLEGLWVLQHHDVVDTDLLKQLLQAREFRARAAAVRVLQLWFNRVDDAMSLVAAAVNDPAPRVRLEAVRALSFVSTAEAADLALQALKHETDYYLDYALDSTITTLEKAWKPAMTSGRMLAKENPAGLAYLLDRLTATELTALPRSEPVLHELLSRPGVDRAIRVEALNGLAKSSGRTVVDELLDAVSRIDGAPGSAEASTELLALAGSDPTIPALGRRGQTPYDRLERLALSGRTAEVRRGAWAALVRSEGGVDEAWRLASISPRSQIDFLDGVTTQALDSTSAAALHPRVAAMVDRVPAGATAPAVTGRYLRILLPGRDKVLGLAEVAVKGGGSTLTGRAAQSTYVPGGDLGGFPGHAVDGVVDRKQRGKTSSFTTQENDPWWELDLGADRAIDTVVIHPFVAEGRTSMGGLHVSVLDSARAVVFVADGLQTTLDSHLLQLGGDLSAPLRESAIRALARIPGHDDEVVKQLTTLMDRDDSRAVAARALTAVPPERWPADQLAPLSERLLAYVTAIPVSERTGSDFKQAVALGRAAAARIGGSEGTRLAGALDALAVRTVRVTALLAQMKFDVERFAVTPGEEVEIVFVNADHMPHNLLVTRPGTLEDVSLKAEAMASQPDAFQKHFVPDSPDVLHATPLINHDEIARLRFTAPASSGDYPFVCTFPGHWRTMNGVMEVKP
jgi:azurin